MHAVVQALAAARRAGTGPVNRGHTVVTAILTAKAQFSITARLDKAVQKAISGIPETAWVSIKYPEAIFDEEQRGGSPTRRSPKPTTPPSSPRERRTG
jgi:hypothetical protein